MKKFQIGVQLCSLSGALKADVEGTLRALSEMGCDCVEMFYDLFGKTEEEWVALLKKYDLACPTVHLPWPPTEEKVIEGLDFARRLGAKYAAIPAWHQKRSYGTPVWEETKKIFAHWCEEARARGIQLMLHNHEFEFFRVKGVRRIDSILADVPALEPQFDLAWLQFPGADPVEYIRKYAGRVHVLHMKDFVCDCYCAGEGYTDLDEDGNPDPIPGREDCNLAQVPVGQGRLDVPAILAAAEEVGAEHLIVEHEGIRENHISVIKESIDYLRALIH